MPLTTVTTVSGTGQKVPLCSCSWEGTKTRVASDAWREANRHARDAHQSTAGRSKTSTAAAEPAGETR